MEDPNLQNWVHRYLSGEMEETERLTFEAACREQEELKEVLTLELQTRYATQTAGRKSLENIHISSGAPKKPIFWYRVAAVFLALLLLSVSLYMFWPKQQSYTELYTRYYSAPPLSQIRDSEGLDSLYLLASTAYMQQNWKQASTLFEKYLSNFNQYSDTQAYLALGICYLELEAYPKAQENFSKIALASSPYYFDARWYSALTYLKNEEGRKSKEQLELLQTSNVYRKKAQELWEKIDL